MSCALLVCATMVVGCDVDLGPAPINNTTTPTLTGSPTEQAAQVMGPFHVVLPVEAQHIQVFTPPLGEFRAKAVVSFTAPRDQVIRQTCGNIPLSDGPPFLVGTDGDILKSVGIVLNEKDFTLCRQYTGGRSIHVLMPRAENATTYIVLYHAPFH